MTVTPDTLTRASGVAAVAAGAIFIGVQINHPHLDATSIATTELVVRNSLKVLMAALALVGISGMYLTQVEKMGRLGLAGYVVFGANYLIIMGTSFLAAYVLPAIAESNPSYVDDVLDVASGGRATGDIGLLSTVLAIQGGLFLAGGLVFGVALYRARVLARWAAVLLSVGGVVTAALTVLPDAFYRLLAFPNSIALIGLGCSLWLATRTDTTARPAAVDVPRLTAAGAE